MKSINKWIYYCILSLFFLKIQLLKAAEVPTHLYLPPFFQALSVNQFPALASENFGAGLGSSFVSIPSSSGGDEYSRMETGLRMKGQMIPIVTGYFGGKLPLYHIRAWARSSILPETFRAAGDGFSIVGFGVGREFNLWQMSSILASDLLANISYHRVQGLPGIKHMQQLGFDLILTARLKFLLGVKAFASLGLAHQQWRQFLSKQAYEKSYEISKSNNYDFVVPVKVGVRVNLGLIDLFTEYSLLPTHSFSIATGLSV